MAPSIEASCYILSVIFHALAAYEVFIRNHRSYGLITIALLFLVLAILSGPR